MSARDDYIVVPIKGRYDSWHIKRSDPYDDELVKSFDRKLHRALTEIFSELHLTSDQVKKLTRGRKKRTDNDSLIKLISKREPTVGKRLLKRNRLSLLWISILCRYQDSAELLVRSGADVNECYGLKTQELTKKSTLLHALLQMYPSAWNERHIDLLIEHGADLQARDSNRCTLLHVAARHNRVKEIEMLLQKGADVNDVRRNDMTPLLDAALSIGTRVEVLSLLIRHGADIKARDCNGETALHYVARGAEENVDLARFLIEKGLSPREQIYSNQFQPIHLAASKGHNQLINLFLDHGANVNARGPQGESPLYAAAQDCENPAVLLTLLKRGANIDMKTYSGFTALHALGSDRYYYGQENEIMQKINILLGVGADMFVEAHDGSTPFDAILHKNARYPLRLLKKLALRKACLEPSTEFEEERIIEAKYPNLWNFDYYQRCVEELNRIKSTKFIKSGTFFELLTKCQCQLLDLMRYREFRCEFGVYDLNVFPMYAADMLKAFEHAEHYYRSMLDQENLINEAVHNTWPHIIVRKIARYTLKCEVCQTKETVQASRSMSI